MNEGAAIPFAMDRRRLLAAGAFAALAGSLPRFARAATMVPAKPMPHLRALLERWVGPGKFPGMVASLGLPGRATDYIAMGSQGFTDRDAIDADSLFRIYSMTKPVTGMAAMQLVAEGKLGLDQPLAEILPEFARMKVQDHYDGSLTEVHEATRPITMRHLLTHTSGIGYSIVQSGPIRAEYQRLGLIPGQVSRMRMPGLFFGEPVRSLAEFTQRLATVPLVADPGTRWSYSMGLDVMGRVIEVASGQPFDAFLRERIFEPAGMTSTWFRVPASVAHRLTTNYAAVGDVLVPIDRPETSVYLDAPAFPFGGSGLVCSPRDYDRFLRMLAGRGEIEGRRVLDAAAVATGTSDLMPPAADRSAIPGEHSGFGAGGRVGLGSEAGLFGWSGAAGTVGMVDMARGLTSQLFVQFMPPDAYDLLPEFQTALKADVMSLTENAPA